jgi:hypothetical protein
MFSGVLRIITHAQFGTFDVMSDKSNIGWKCNPALRKEIVDRTGSLNSLIVNVV